MELQDLIHSLENRTEQIRELIEAEMPSRGDVEGDCQRLCLLNRLSELEYAINGITKDDMIEIGGIEK